MLIWCKSKTDGDSPDGREYELSISIRNVKYRHSVATIVNKLNYNPYKNR